MNPRRDLLLFAVLLSALSLACGPLESLSPSATEAPTSAALVTMAVEPTQSPAPVPSPTAPIAPTSTLKVREPSPTAAAATEAVAPTEPPPKPSATAEVADQPAPPAAGTAADWGTICQPNPKEEGKEVANLAMGSQVELVGYLSVKSVSFRSQDRMVFTLRPVAWDVGNEQTRAVWDRGCIVHVWILDRQGQSVPNSVSQYGETIASVIILDKDLREIGGWARTLDSRHVRVTGPVVKPYGGETGLDGSNTINAEQITLLE